jgi:serine/threonine protein kinase
MPSTVKSVITIGSSCWIGEVNDSTILKYPHDRGIEIDRFQTEYKILSIIGQNPRIIGLKDYTDDGLYLERAVNGDIHDYLTNNPTISLQQRLTWCRQAAEAVAYAHSKRVIHCDIRPRNLLLDKNLDLKLADFQGKHLSADGEVLLNGFASEPSRFSCPRELPDYANIKTDLFALGSTIYFIMMGHDIFPDIDEQDDGFDEEVQRRFRTCQFPQESHACSTITEKCWRQAYSSAIEVAQDVKAIEKAAEASG